MSGRRSLGGCVVLPEAELVPLRVLAGREPAHVRDGHRVVGLAAELLHACGAVLDVVYGEVDARSTLAGLHVRDRSALLVADPRHVVLGWTGVGLELPPEERS